MKKKRNLMMMKDFLEKKFVIVIGAIALCLLGCSLQKLNDDTFISTALEVMYDSNFKYTVSSTMYNKDEKIIVNYSGEYVADPYVDHRVYETVEDSIFEEIYYYSDEKTIGESVNYCGLQDGEWLYGSADRIYVSGYKEYITVKSKTEETIDGKVCTIYTAEHVIEANKQYGLSQKLEATIKQQYYLEQESGKIVRIVTDFTDLNRMVYIANLMANNDINYETAQKNADANGNYEEIEDMKIEYQDENFSISIPNVK